MQAALDDVKNIMVNNIEKVLERGEKLELLVDKTEHLNQQAFVFQNQVRYMSLCLCLCACVLFFLSYTHESVQ